MKKLIPITVIFLFFAVFGLIASGMQVYAGNSPPQVSAASAVVMDAATGRVLYEKNGYSKQFPASTTKIMTCLLAIDSGCDPEEMVEISERAAAEEGSSVYMEAGEMISFEDLIYALMLRSGNDSAIALAEHISGTAEAFAEEMNEKARELGAKDTNFVTVNGLHDDEHYTTAYDMALITREAMKNDYFRKVAGTQEWNASRDVDKFNYFYNKNKVLYQYDGGNGVKIGYTTAAGRCLVASSQRNGMELITVVFSAPDWFNDTYKLMDYIYENYEIERIIAAEEPLAGVMVENGEKNHTLLISEYDIAYPKRVGEEIEISFKIDTQNRVSAPIKRGDPAGSIIIFCDGEETGREELVYREDIDVITEDDIVDILISFITKKE